ncbi:hypothetical protein SO802_031729 [Lithocarpus litseifolius]|uniref:Uncharacterized protein n=1 Tax=Lithocarpus litseifolius TaxID=425828 RepID=A0AAW2BN30_9ROSI
MASRPRNSKGTNAPPVASEPVGENEVASRLNLENLCISQFADLLQRTRRTVLTMRIKRVLVPQAMTASVGKKRKSPEGKMAEEPPVILCTAG